jgi:hypothetical protein
MEAARYGSMATTVEELRQRVEELERQVRELRSNFALEQSGSAPERWHPRRVRLSDPEEVRRLLDAALTKMGVDLAQPAIPAEEVQQMMLREGVRPEDRLLSCGIIDAREE